MKIALLLLVGACGFSKLPKLSGSADAPGGGDAPADVPADTAAPDAGVCAAASVMCASSDTLRTCSSPGVPAVDTTCNWGCIADTSGPHCGLLAPTGGAATSSDTDTQSFAQLVDVTMPSGTTISGDDGSISGLRGAGTGVVSGIDYKVASANQTVAVFRMKSVMISGPVTIVGVHSIVIIADVALSVDGIVNSQGNCLLQTSPGGFPGGATSATGPGPGGGAGPIGGTGGGGGAGYGGRGGQGGVNGIGGSGGPMSGDAAVSMLVGGSGGGGGGGANAFGGHGGGAIQLITNGTLTLTGGINAGGCGGRGPNSGGGGGGAGAGGTIVLEGKTVRIAGALAVNGGAGGGGGNGASRGGDATLDRNFAMGGASTSGSSGGNGAVAGRPDGDPAGSTNVDGGGGGGGLGRIRVNTQLGTAAIDPNAILSPAPNDTGTTFSQGVTQVQ